MSENPWWHPADDDDWDEPLPPVVTLEPDYHAKLPLGGDGELAWPRTRFSPLSASVVRSSSGLVTTKFDGDSALVSCRK